MSSSPSSSFSAAPRLLLPPQATSQGAPQSKEGASIKPRFERPQQLRTKSGCLTCRKRRKKCDERKPSCIACERNRISCVWSEQVLQSLQRQSSIESSSSTSPPANTTPPKLSPQTPSQAIVRRQNGAVAPYVPSETRAISFDDVFQIPASVLPAQQDVLLSYFAGSVLPNVIHSQAHPIYKDNVHLKGLISQYPPLLNSVLAYSALHSPAHSGSSETVMKYYASAVSGLRDDIATGVVDGSEDYVGAAVNVLILFERGKNEHPGGAAHHIKAAAQLFALRQAKRKEPPSADVMAFERIIAEAIVFNAATMILYEGDPMELATNVQQLRYLEPFCAQAAVSATQEITDSPVLGIPYPFYELLAVISLLFLTHKRHAPKRVIGPLLEQVQGWEDRLNFYAFSRTGTSRQSPQIQARWLYVAACNILLLMRHPEDQTETLSRYISGSLEILERFNTAAVFSSYCAWPCYVLGLAVVQDEDRRRVKEFMRRMAGSFDRGYVARSITILDKKWTRG